MKILLSAYACEPNRGSEPGVGWNTAWELSKYHSVWVLTRESNRAEISDFQSQYLNSNIRFIYCEPPGPAKYLKPAQIPHYYCWQLGAYLVAKQLHRQERFDIVHHVTYVRYSTPSFLSLLPTPFIWGPVGGGESTPPALRQDFSANARIYEALRSLTHRLGERDPFTRATVQKSTLVRATTAETSERLQLMGAKNIQICSAIGLSKSELSLLTCFPLSPSQSVRFVSIARLLHWKGIHLSIRAFAQAELGKDVEYWVIGDGPERAALEKLAVTLDVDRRVKFLGALPRSETLQQLKKCHILLHPSMHDSGGLVCLEAMAAGRPVICLDTGGPAIQVTDQTGFKITPGDPQQVVRDLALAVTTLATDSELRSRMSEAGRQHVESNFSWEIKGKQLAQLCVDLVSQSQARTNKSPSCAS